MTDHKIIGYTERKDGFYPLYETPRGYIVTAAFILCKHCRGAIASMGGPRYDAVCLTCYEKNSGENE